MTEKVKPNHPWLLAAWPGIGNVATSAGYYLLAKLGMHVMAEFDADGLFDVDDVDVKKGIIQAGRRPRNRLFAWTDAYQKHSRSLRCSRP
jgi:hypothetical protein